MADADEDRAREALQRWVAAEVAFWDEKVDEEPEDADLVARRDAFVALADHVADLPEGSVPLACLDDLVDEGSGSPGLGPVGREILRGFRVADPEEDPAAFLRRFCAALAA